LLHGADLRRKAPPCGPAFGALAEKGGLFEDDVPNIPLVEFRRAQVISMKNTTQLTAIRTQVTTGA
jgi:hypothetical protein